MASFWDWNWKKIEMIDFFASITIALIITMTVVLFLGNRHQAMILKEMRLVMEDWYQAKMRDRREAFKKQFHIEDGLQWLGDQVNLNILEQGRRLENPRAIEYFTTEGVRLVISPDKKGKLRSDLHKAEGKRHKVAKLVEPLLGYRPGKTQMIERSNRTVHEWFDLEIAVAFEKLNIHWGELNSLYFYLIPLQMKRQNEEGMQAIFNQAGNWLKEMQSALGDWMKQQVKKVSG